MTIEPAVKHVIAGLLLTIPQGHAVSWHSGAVGFCALVPPLPQWVPKGRSGFLPQPEDMQARSTGPYKIPIIQLCVIDWRPARGVHPKDCLQLPLMNKRYKGWTDKQTLHSNYEKLNVIKV